ncbi:MAG: hypothetical protein PHU23_15495, partial [Dehalococcoidales bacterium]|nr:hypothetical protein [Dehalococcoidales bacterium]
QDIEETAMKEADNITKALAGRLMTYAVKMAALFTIGREDFDENSKIELPHIQEAARLVVEYFLPIGKIIIDEVARAESKNTQDKIIGTIKRYNGLINQRDLLRVLHMKLKEVEEAIEALILSEEIERQIVKGKKGNIVYYKLRECHSDIVSHKAVYKGNNKGSLYTPSCGTMTLKQMGQDQDSDVDEGGKEAASSSVPTIGPHPRKEDPGFAKFKAKVQSRSRNTCRLCGQHFDIPLTVSYQGGYICGRCRRDGAPTEPPKADAQARLGEVA